MSNLVHVTREFSKRNLGAIGSCALRIDATGFYFTLGDKPEVTLPEASVHYLANFALQSLQDAYAGSESLAEAQGAFLAKADKLIAGEIGVRGTGESVNDWQLQARNLVRAKVKLALGKAYKDADAAGRNAMLDATIAKNMGNKAFIALVVAKVAEAAAERAKALELAEAIGATGFEV